MNEFQGRVYLVSGASSGIGEATAALFERAGATVYGLASNPASLAAARERNPNVEWLSGDLTKRGEVEAAVAKIGRLDGIVNNAGVYEFAPLEASSDELLRRHFEVNVFGLIRLTQAALGALRESKGTIVNVSSTSATKPMANQSVYAATKGAVESLTVNWAVELAPQGIRVNAIAPGPTMTPGIAKIPMPAEMLDAVRKQIVATVPLARTGTSEEVARWILHLSDPSVTWVTGQIIGVDGGLAMS